MFSHKWAQQVLKQRGISTHTPEELRSAIESLGSDDARRMYEAFSRLERGTESSEELEWLLQSITSARNALPTQAIVSEANGAPKASSKRRLELCTETRPVSITSSDSTRAKTERPKHHMYSQKAALTVELDELRKGNADLSVAHTVILEGAMALAPRQYDWANKIAFQFTRNELPLLACALLGMLEGKLEFGNHGSAADKFLTIEDQGDRLYVSLKQGARMVPVPVGGPDVYAWLDLVMRALSANSPAMTDAIQHAALSRIANLHNAKMHKSKLQSANA
jgi:hypothetical protein